ncbi:hypothetical protein HIM_11111 [Hirsutella minnesotensis 3608]|uniref:RBR-type E3 ubiquitin transferase n=1 Tax=Hirsutella minnesotensis 3608 TaxID=1043627 RepID=A0A0F8A1K3_9HYPO|nr:hypothetical protein HIM_11111 [Hirsutella minnesotensis 3608]
MTAPCLETESHWLVLELQLEELQGLQGQRADSGRSPDFELALALYKQEIESSMRSRLDEALCRSIAEAVRRDGDAISSFVREEEQAQRDRNMAQTLSGARPSTQIAINESRRSTRDHLSPIHLSKPQESNNVSDEAEGREGGSPPRTVAKDLAQDADGKGIGLRDCTGCGGKHATSKLSTVPCSHEYCRGCLNTVFNLATLGESLFPPRCCQKPISVDTHLDVLEPNLVGTFKAKEIEFGTSDRTYCHHPECSTFVPPQFIGDDIATCVRCLRKTCVLCKEATHDKECPKDEATQEVLEIAKRNGWQRCSSCHRLVELRQGCNHITCICRASFCYVCGKTWKTCSCPQWEERNLYNRAEMVVNRDIDNQQLPGEMRAAVVRNAAQHIAAHPACSRHQWRLSKGQHQCEECDETSAHYAFECCRCHILACRRCRFNRL